MGSGGSTLCTQIDIKDTNGTVHSYKVIETPKTSRVPSNNGDSDEMTTEETNPLISIDPKREEIDPPKDKLTDINLHEHEPHETIHGIGDLSSAAASDENKAKTSLCTNKEQPELLTNAELKKPVDQNEKNVNVGEAGRAGDLKFDHTPTTDDTRAQDSTIPVPSTKPSTGVDEDAERDDSYVLLRNDSDQFNLHESKSSFNRSHTKTMRRVSCPVVSQSVRPQSPVICARKKQESKEREEDNKSKLNPHEVGTIKLPGVNELVPAIHTALAVRKPKCSHKVITVRENHGNEQYYCSLDNVCISRQPLTESSYTPPPMRPVVNTYSEYKTPTADASTLVLTDRLDESTSMYVCAEGTDYETEKMVVELAARTDTSSVNFPNMCSTQTNKDDTLKQAQLDTEDKPESDDKLLEFTTTDSRTGKYNEDSSVSLGEEYIQPISSTSDMLTSTVVFRKDNSTVPPSTAEFKQSRTNSYAMVEKYAACLNDKHSSVRRPVMEGRDPEYESNKATCSQDEIRPTNQTDEMQNGDCEHPYNVDVKREGIICTPSVEEPARSTLTSPGSSADVSLSSTPTRTVPQLSLDETVCPESEKVSTLKSEDSGNLLDSSYSKTGSPDNNKLVVMQAATPVDKPKQILTKGQCGPIQLIGGQTYGSTGNQEKISMEITDFLQVVQSADDFEILIDDDTAGSTTAPPDSRSLMKSTATQANLGSNTTAPEDGLDSDVIKP
ncbi:unnamed protein product [Calicophoron daubneyi]|uniref:Uncharacterized protein n=1 Tax=Calicophoron daubneyi TaxID=300641 RepID=A0AAV2T2T1_CALDB